MPRCLICQEERFYESAGYFYCQTCDTQTQDLHKTINETDFTSQTAFATRANAFRIGQDNKEDNADGDHGLSQMRSSLFTPGQPESLFLLVDLVLQAQVNWLMENAGARKELKDVMTSVWFSYLTRALPDVKNGIVQSLFDGHNWSKSLRKMDLCAIANCEIGDLQRQLKHLELTLSKQTDENRDPTHADGNMIHKGKDSCPGLNRVIKKKNPSSHPPKLYCRSADPSKISLSRMLALLVISLHICQESILISDILRWIRLLHLPCVDPSAVLPDDQLTTFYLLGKLNAPITVSYHEIEWDVTNLLGYLEIPSGALQKLSILPVIDRLVQELNLPLEIVLLVNEFAQNADVDWNISFTATRRTWATIRPENVEASVMALIIHSLIFLFGLNSITEHEITIQTRRIATELDANLFDLDIWMHHINSRRLLIFQHSNLLQHHSITAGTGFLRKNLISEHRKLTWQRLTRNKYKDENYEDLHRSFQETRFHHKIPHLHIELPVTLRPFRACAENLARIHPEVDVNFYNSSLAHLTTSIPNASLEVIKCLELIQMAQKNARARAGQIGKCNIRLAARKLLKMKDVPSEDLRWLITVCAEVIEHRPVSLLGRLVHLESILWNTSKV